jgi:hypothetical protein
MKRSNNLITAEHPNLGLLWAAFDASVHHIVGRVADSRFAARLAPFKSRAEAEAALIAKGCKAERVAA